ncbi:MAG TPA: glycosyltransferase, partial [Streptosporangiaceae bacterium]|nr:glycosyltransferase [Streptosporangiaceae bacterium]
AVAARVRRPHRAMTMPRPRLAVLSHSAIEPSYQRKWAQVAAAGFTVRLYLPDRWPETGRWIRAKPSSAGNLFVEVLSAVWPGRVARWFPRGFKAALGGFRPDLVLAEEEPYGLACAVAARAAAGLRVPFIFYTWENLVRGYRWPQGRLIRAVTARAAGAIAGNRDGLAVLRRWKLRGGTAVIPQYGVDGRMFRPQPAATCRRRLGWTLRGPVIGFVGRLLPEKGIETLLAAAARLPKTVRVVIVGNGPHAAALRGLAAPLRDRIRFMPAVPRARIPDVLGALDVLVLPSRTTPAWKEQFGRILAEAHACGRWAVGSDSGEIPHVLGSRRFVFPEGDATALARRIRPLLARRAPASIRRRVLARFSEQAVAGATAGFLRRILARRHAGAGPSAG